MGCEKKILYIDDMELCHDKMRGLVYALNNNGHLIELYHRQTALSGIYRAKTKNIGKYCLAIVDINLDYNPELLIWEQTTEGLDVIEAIKKRKTELRLKKPFIWAVSFNDYREQSLMAGADRFFFKRDFFGERGLQSLDAFLKGNN